MTTHTLRERLAQLANQTRQRFSGPVSHGLTVFFGVIMGMALDFWILGQLQLSNGGAGGSIPIRDVILGGGVLSIGPIAATFVFYIVYWLYRTVHQNRQSPALYTVYLAIPIAFGIGLEIYWLLANTPARFAGKTILILAAAVLGMTVLPTFAVLGIHRMKSTMRSIYGRA